MWPQIGQRVLGRDLARLELVARPHEPNPPAAFRQTECGGVPSATSIPFASAWRMASSIAAHDQTIQPHWEQLLFVVASEQAQTAHLLQPGSR